MCAYSWITAAVLLVSLCTVRSQEKDKGPDPYAFDTKTYQLPSEELEFGFVSKDKGKLRAPALPPASASSAEQEAFLKRSHDVLKEYLHLQGVALPPGSVAGYDPASGTLTVRCMNAVHGMLSSLSDSFCARQPKVLIWTVDIIEAPAAEVRAAMKSTLGKTDHSTVQKDLAAKGKVVVALRGETKGGQRARGVQSFQQDAVTEYTQDARKYVEAAYDRLQIGTQFELDPVIGPDGGLIDLTFSLRHHYAPPQRRWDSLSAGSSPKLEAAWLDYPEVSVQTAMTFVSRQPQMVGVWTLAGHPDAARAANNMQAAFVKVTKVDVMPLMQLRIEQIVKAVGEKVEPTPKQVRPVADPSLPAGMIVRRLHVQPNFLISFGDKGGASPAPADPFAAAPPASEPRFTIRATAEDVLRAQGVDFPKGASANYLPVTSELVVRNTPANIDAIVEILEAMKNKRPRQLRFTVHVVQADAAQVRQWSQDTLDLPDHGSTWQAVEKAVTENKATLLRSAQLCSNSGQRAGFINVLLYDETEGLSLGSPAKTETTTQKDDDKAGSKTTTTTAGSDHLSAKANRTPVGFSFEVDPVIGPDGRTIDITLAGHYDCASPERHVEPAGAPEAPARLAAPEMVFHNQEFQTSTSLLSGFTRMLSIWQPTGVPDVNGAPLMQAIFLHAEIQPIDQGK